MKKEILILLILAIVFFSACVKPPGKVQCADGTIVSDFSQCLALPGEKPFIQKPSEGRVFPQTAPQASAEPELNELIPIKGCAVEELFDFSELSEIGCNYAQIIVWPQVLSSGEVTAPSENAEKQVLQQIMRAREFGFKIYLVIYPVRIVSHESYGAGLQNTEKVLQGIEEIALKWAKIAEQYEIEMFSPVNELFLWVGVQEANEWHENILPKLKKIYSGNLVPRGLQFYQFDPLSEKPFELKNTEFDFSGWDYIASDIYCLGIESRHSEENLKKCFSATLNKSLELKNKFNAKGVFYGEMSHPGGTDAETFDLFFSENYGKADGWFLWHIRHYSDEAKHVMKRYFTEKLAVSEAAEIPEILDIEEIASRIPRYEEVILQENFAGKGFQSINGEDPFILEALGQNYLIKAKFKIVEGSLKIVFEEDAANKYGLSITPVSFFDLDKKLPGEEHPLVLAELKTSITRNEWHDLEIARNGKNFAFYLDNELMHAFSDTESLQGSFQFDSHIDKVITYSKVIYDEITVLGERGK